MKNRYEGLLVLNVKGNEEGAKEVIERLEGDFKKEGAASSRSRRLDRRQFTYVAGPLDSGYYVNFIFPAEPTSSTSCGRTSSSTRTSIASTTRSCARKGAPPEK